jgi:hypothetical protein
MRTAKCDVKLPKLRLCPASDALYWSIGMQVSLAQGPLPRVKRELALAVDESLYASIDGSTEAYTPKFSRWASPHS